MFELYYFGRIYLNLSNKSCRYFHVAHKNPNFIIFSGLFLALAKFVYIFYRVEVFLVSLLGLFLSLFGLTLFVTFFWTLRLNYF